MDELKGLDAVVLVVKDLAKQKAFYQSILGLELEADYGDAAFFKCGKQKIALFAHSHHPEGTRSLGGASKGISHPEFGISNSGPKKMKQQLTDAGLHAYRENFKDADGNLFHFNAE